jgi:Protein of unknown function (DUF 659)
MCKMLKCVPTTYEPPKRNLLAGRLLDVLYNNKMKQQMLELRACSSIFGISLLSDGATVKRMPLINILASGVEKRAAVLEVVDCSGHMAQGSKKDAKYIAGLLKPHIKMLDPDEDIVDLLWFDGASNVQKAGEILEATFPRATSLHGAEHVTSLFFSDIAKLAPIRMLIKLSRRLYRVFGSGAMHAPYAMFQENAKLANGGKNIGLMRAADTRMAGHFICFLRLLRLMLPLKATVGSIKFQALKFTNNKAAKAQVCIDLFLLIFCFVSHPLTPFQVIAFVQDDRMWLALKDLMRAVYPALRVLRLADRNSAGMDKLLYFVLKTDETILSNLGGVHENDWFGYPTLEALDEDLRKDNELLFSDEECILAGNQTDRKFDEVLSSDEEDEGDDDEESFSSDVVSDEDGDGADIPFQDAIAFKIKSCWDHRRKRLVSDFAIAGYMLCPIPEVLQHCRENKTPEMHKAVDRVIEKLFYGHGEQEIEKKLDTFWQEWSNFHHMSGDVYGKAYIQNSGHLVTGESHLWHNQYSLPFTQVLGHVACRVTSKTLGIGASERAWAAVKHLKTDKRSHLSAKAVAKQSTLFCIASIDKAHQKKKLHPELTEAALWMDSDLEFDDSLGKWGHTNPSIPPPKRLLAPRHNFKCWIEEWELEEMKRNDPVTEAKFLKKYGGLKWIDPDDPSGPIVVTAKHDAMEFQGGRNGCGWCLLAVNDEGDEEPWQIDVALGQIEEYEQPPELNVFKMKTRETDE